RGAAYRHGQPARLRTLRSRDPHDRRGTRALRGLHLMATGPVLTIHRAADEIGGNCIELEHDGRRLLLDAGSPLVGDGTTVPQGAIPRTLDTSKDIAGLVISHPHQDHWGLL